MRKHAGLLLLIFGNLAAQHAKPADSLEIYLRTHPRDTNYVLTLNDDAFLMVQKGDFESAENMVARMDSMSNKLHFRTGYYKTMNMRGVIEYGRQHPDKAMVYFLKSETIIRRYGLPKKTYQNALNNIMIIYDQMGNREKATQYAAKLIAYQEKNRLKPLKSAPYSQLGKNLKFYKKFPEALPYLRKALAIDHENGDQTSIAISENDLGNLYDDLGQTQNAANHYAAGLDLAKKISYKTLQTDLLINLARMQKKSKKYAQSEASLIEAESILNEIGLRKPLKTLYHNLGDLYLEQKQFAKARRYYLQSLEVAKENQSAEELYSIYQALAGLEDQTGNDRKAYRYLSAAQSYKDDMFRLETAKATEDLLRKYESEKKEQKIRSLSAQNQIKNLQINAGKRQKWFFISGIAGLLAIALLIFKQSRNRRKSNQKLRLLNAELDQANQSKTRFFNILNHDLRGPVSSLISFLHLQQDDSGMMDEATRERLHARTLSSAENLLESMEDILIWSKGQMQQFRPQPRRFEISGLFTDLSRHFQETVPEPVFINDEKLSFHTDYDSLKTILRNLIANSANALAGAENPEISVRAFTDKRMKKITVTDNGPGGSPEQFRAVHDDSAPLGIKSGLGLHLVRDLSRIIGANVEVQSNSNGTTFTVSFPDNA